MTDMEIESEEDLLAERLACVELLNPQKKIDLPVVVISDSEEETDVAPYGSDSDSDSDYRPKVLQKPKKISYRKKAIPLSLKRAVWARWIGDDVAKTKCLCCKVQEIHIMSYHCGHVVAEKRGGGTVVDNLRPICQMCNSSMGTKNMNVFMRENGL